MNKQHLKLPLFFIVILVGLASCKKEERPDDILHQTIHKLEDSQNVRFKYVSHWDNRFNESTFSDTAAVNYSRIDDSFHGFGFHVNTHNSECIFDGKRLKIVEHKEKKVVNFNEEEINSDSSYFSGFMFWDFSPREILTADIDTVWQEPSYFIYQSIGENKSKNGGEEVVRNEKLFYVDSETKLIDRIKRLSINNGDTAQIITHYFTDYHFSEEPILFSDIERSKSAGYAEVNEEDLENERMEEATEAGEMIIKQNYKDVTGERISLIGEPTSKTLIMFSFIGCGGCEYAMKELKKADYKINEQVNLYYSSPHDKNTTLKKYLDKKGFPFKAFSKESNMSEDFSVFLYPTFVLINSEGVIEKTMSGYGDEVREIIF